MAYTCSHIPADHAVIVASGSSNFITVVSINGYGICGQWPFLIHLSMDKMTAISHTIFPDAF